MKILTLLMIILMSAGITRAAWEDWELGGEFGLGLGRGSKRGCILSPAVKVTGTRKIGDMYIELGLGYMFGSDTEINYTIDAKYHPDDVKNDAGKEITVKLNVIPMTINFIYTIYENFYIGAGLGLYHVFYREVPDGNRRVNPNSERGETVSSPVTTAFGFQQMVGMEIFPLRENWKWFIGMKSFVTTDTGKAGRLVGITVGSRIRYIW